MIKEGRVQIKTVSFKNGNIWPPKHLRVVSIKHGYRFSGPVVQIMKSLLCPDYLKCTFCDELIDKAKRTEHPDLDMYY